MQYPFSCRLQHVFKACRRHCVPEAEGCACACVELVFGRMRQRKTCSLRTRCIENGLTDVLLAGLSLFYLAIPFAILLPRADLQNHHSLVFVLLSQLFITAHELLLLISRWDRHREEDKERSITRGLRDITVFASITYDQLPKQYYTTPDITLDPIETPVWFRALPAQPATPPNNFGPPMSTVVHHIGVPAIEIPSPAPSDTSMSTRQGDQDVTALPPRRSPRPGRSPDRPLLRTAFRNFSGVATVVVGETGNKSRPQTQYLVHKELLTSASPFFAAALNSTFAEGMEQVVRLPEEKPESFEWFLQWLYTGTLTTQPSSIDPMHRTTYIRGPNTSFPAGSQISSPFETHLDGDLRNSAGSPKYFLLLDLYALSDRLLTTPLSNHILSTIARLSESTNSVPTPSDTWILYDTIRDTSPLRTLILDLFAYKKTDKLLETHKDDWHPRFLRELVVKLKRPGPEAIERHSLVAWRPRSWSTSKACEGCKEVLKPGVSADKCCGCEKAFCGECLRRHSGEGWNLPNDVSGCKPWMGRGMCGRYHEHGGGEACG